MVLDVLEHLEYVCTLRPSIPFLKSQRSQAQSWHQECFAQRGESPPAQSFSPTLPEVLGCQEFTCSLPEVTIPSLWWVLSILWEEVGTILRLRQNTDSYKMPPPLLREGRAMNKMTSICKRHGVEAGGNTNPKARRVMGIRA